MIGFENQTKREALKAGIEQKEVVNSEIANIGTQDNSIVKMETITRVEQLGGFLCSDEFAKLGVNEKIGLVRDFSYFSQVLATMP